MLTVGQQNIVVAIISSSSSKYSSLFRSSGLQHICLNITITPFPWHLHPCTHSFTVPLSFPYSRLHPCNFHTTVTAWWYCVRHNHKSNSMQTGCRIKSVSPPDSPVTAQQQYAYNCNLGPVGRTGHDRGDLQYEIVNIICHKFSLSLVRADMVSVTTFNVHGLKVQLTCFN